MNPCYIEHPNPYITTMKYFLKEQPITCDRVRGLVPDKGLSQQTEAMLNNKLLHLRFS